ncbi:MAG: dynamin family protein [Megamonas funiformis]|uniref:dynamin family protein n=1 Tax=Megamonas funiformis TaxID=437897 RepID=UPI002A808527|nr:dynamin family protein [Megamonas funiformis]MDY3874889.1 dynamin family protein [Megamonas funiformis]
MDCIKNELSIASICRNHPILKENDEFKIKYINILEFFYNKYCNNDNFAKQNLSIYKNIILEKCLLKYVYRADKVNKYLKDSIFLKINKKNGKWRIFSYRFILAIDCLFICAFDNEDLGKTIISNLKLMSNDFLGFFINKKYDALYLMLYKEKNLTPNFYDIDFLLSKWWINKNQLSKPIKKIVVTANMSAGKSTLINALIGKKLLQAKNEACTSREYRIINKSFEDDLVSAFDKTLKLNVSLNELKNDEKKGLDKIYIGTYFNGLEDKQRFCFIDTPGVNYSENNEHEQLTKKVIEEKDYDKLVYVINSNYLGTNDDAQYLKYIIDKVKDKEIIIVLNKLDNFDIDEDNIKESIDKVYKDLQRYGLKNSKVCPISAYAGLLAKRKIAGEELSKIESRKLENYIYQFEEPEYDLSVFYEYDINILVKNYINKHKNHEKDSYLQLLNNTGILSLEYMLSK